MSLGAWGVDMDGIADFGVFSCSNRRFSYYVCWTRLVLELGVHFECGVMVALHIATDYRLSEYI